MSSQSLNDRDLALIREIVGKTKLFIDTCSLMDPMYPTLEKFLFPALQAAGAQLFVPLRVLDELKRHAQSEIKSKAESANRALTSLAVQQKKNLISIKGNPHDNFADNVFSTQFTKFRLQYRLTLITQDVALAHDILLLNQSASQKAHKISVYRITKRGNLSINDGDIERQEVIKNAKNNQSGQRIDSASKYIEKIKSEEKLFSLKNKIVDYPDSVVSSGKIPKEGDQVYAVIQKKNIRLTRLLASGGEGSVFETSNPDVVCKIYQSSRLTLYRLEKLRKMVESEFSCKGICWPTDVVLNENHRVVGYLMERAKGFELQKSIFMPPLLKKHFGNWTKKDTVRLSITILEKICYLHHHNILIGDINPFNILVVSPTEVYFVDTDSYQIEEFPCPVGTINFTAPEVQKRDFGKTLRTAGNERFAVATLLFMLMLPGKPPYAQQDGDDPITNICKMDFSYPFGEKSNKKTPAGPWRFCWSHLPYRIKEDFYETFRYDGKYAKENERLTASHWLDLFKEYYYLLDSGKLQTQDPEAIKLFPTRFKIVGSNIEKCKLCGQEYAEDRLVQGYCQNCLNKGKMIPCERCGQPVLYKNYRKLIQQKPPFNLCSDCFQRQSQVYKTIKCCDCGRSFDITYREKEFFDRKKYDLPKRCSSCRKNKNAYDINKDTNKVNNSSSSIWRIFSNLFK